MHHNLIQNILPLLTTQGGVSSNGHISVDTKRCIATHVHHEAKYTVTPIFPTNPVGLWWKQNGRCPMRQQQRPHDMFLKQYTIHGTGMFPYIFTIKSTIHLFEYSICPMDPVWDWIPPFFGDLGDDLGRRPTDSHCGIYLSTRSQDRGVQLRFWGFVLRDELSQWMFFIVFLMFFVIANHGSCRSSEETLTYQ